MEMNYYKVICKIGHLGAGKHWYKTFYFKAPNALTAMEMGKKMPMVKHRFLPMSVVKISKEEYEKNIKTSAYERSW